MATKPQAKKISEQPEEFFRAYTRFRTALDALELAALDYCLTPTDSGERVKRMAKVETQVKDLINQWRAPGGKAEEGCPEGYCECDGFCVPYPCPDTRG
jgi:hypothetical protein